MQCVVTAHQHQGEHAVQEVHQGLDLPVGWGLVLLGEILDSAHPRRGEGLGGGKQYGPFGRIVYLGQPGRGLFYVGRVIAVRAVDDEVLAGRRGADELDRVRAAHGAVGRLGLDGRDAEPLERAGVGVAVGVEGHVELGRSQVETVGVLHGELAGPHQARLGPRLVAQLGLELVPQLRQLTVGLELGGEGGDDLLVGHAKGQVGALTVLEPEHLLAHQIPAAARLPQLGRVHDRHQDLLGADRVHLVADDPDDLQPDPLSERQQRIVPRHQLPDVTRAQQQAVAGRAGVGRIVAQRRDVHLGPAHEPVV